MSYVKTCNYPSPVGTVLVLFILLVIILGTFWI